MKFELVQSLPALHITLGSLHVLSLRSIPTGHLVHISALTIQAAHLLLHFLHTATEGSSGIIYNKYDIITLLHFLHTGTDGSSGKIYNHTITV